MMVEQARVRDSPDPVLGELREFRSLVRLFRRRGARTVSSGVVLSDLTEIDECLEFLLAQDLQSEEREVVEKPILELLRELIAIVATRSR